MLSLRRLLGPKTSDLCCAMCIAENHLCDAMHIHCDLRSRCGNHYGVGHDATFIANAMPVNLAQTFSIEGRRKDSRQRSGTEPNADTIVIDPMPHSWQSDPERTRIKPRHSGSETEDRLCFCLRFGAQAHADLHRATLTPLVAQSSAIVVATPPCSAIRFCKELLLRRSDRGVAR